MGMKITKKGDDLIVETDYGAGFVDQENAKWDRASLKNYMSETKRDCLQGSDYSDIKEQIRREILRRDIFWLFWSRHAKESQWVEWEWRTALHEKSIHGIQPHPIDPPDIAPPPAALATGWARAWPWPISSLSWPSQGSSWRWISWTSGSRPRWSGCRSMTLTTRRSKAEPLAFSQPQIEGLDILGVEAL